MKKTITLSVLLLSAIVLAGCSTKTTTQNNTADTATGYTIDEVAMHTARSDCWTSVNGNVYDITSAFGKHPGGDDKLAILCGIEGTENFNKMHGTNEKAKGRLTTLIIGKLK